MRKSNCFLILGKRGGVYAGWRDRARTALNQLSRTNYSMNDAEADPLEAIKRWHDAESTGTLSKLYLELEPGTYFPEVARAVGLSDGGPYCTPSTPSDTISNYVNQLRWLLDELRTIFQTVHPSRRNLGVHGHAMRNLLERRADFVNRRIPGGRGL